METSSKAGRWKDYLLQAGAVAGAIAAILGLLFLLFPKLKRVRREGRAR